VPTTIGEQHKIRQMRRDSQITDSSVRKFKGETVFGWEHEPADERPSEFAPTTRYDTLWTTPLRAPAPALEIPRPRPAQKRGGFNNVWLALVLAVALAGSAIFGVVRWLHRSQATALPATAPAPGSR
jgi:hypothetical protein